MINEGLIKQQINNTLKETDFPSLGEKYKGKVRDVYSKEGKMVMVTTDRISAFDVVLDTIPFKGQVLNQMAVFWFEKTADIVKNHLVESPDPNVMIVHKCKALPIEVIIRGYITGSLWRDYASGKRQLYGITFKEGIKKDQKFSQPIITPSTKAEHGEHDMPISPEEIISKGIVTKELWDEIVAVSLALFKRGTLIAAKQGLILVDTKYEFGLLDGQLVLMDEIHTSDSSRFWFADEYEKRFSAGQDQHMLDKEYLRQWLIAKGFSGQGNAPELTEQIKIEVAQKYIKAFESITGQEFEAEQGDVLARIKKNLLNKDYL